MFLITREYQDTLKIIVVIREELNIIHIHNFVKAGLKITLEIGHMLRSNEVMASIQASVTYIYF